MQAYTSTPNVNTKFLSVLGIIAAVLIPWMMIIMNRSIFGFGMQIILTLTSFVLFLSAIIYDNQNIKHNRSLGYTSNFTKSKTNPENIRLVHRKFILISLGLTVVLFPFYVIAVGLLAMATGWVTVII
jgi:hypothetical protein